MISVPFGTGDILFVSSPQERYTKKYDIALCVMIYALRHLKKHRRTVYAELLTSGKLNDYLADINEQAEDMFFRLVKELAQKEGITEKLKEKDQMLWIQRMNAVRETATETVNNDLIYT